MISGRQREHTGSIDPDFVLMRRILGAPPVDAAAEPDDIRPERFRSEEQLAKFYKRRIAKAKAEDEEAIRIEYARARVAFLRRRAVLADLERQEIERQAMREVDDRQRMRQMYGQPVGAGPGIKPDRFAEQEP